jgi:hypothetical protein
MERCWQIITNIDSQKPVHHELLHLPVGEQVCIVVIIACHCITGIGPVQIWIYVRCCIRQALSFS